jgi:hypothetical protein
LSSVSDREARRRKSWVTVALMSLICVHGLARFFYVYNIFSFFCEHSFGCFSFYALLQLHHMKRARMKRKTRKNFFFVCAYKHHHHHARMQLQAEMIVREVSFFAAMLMHRQKNEQAKERKNVF